MTFHRTAIAFAALLLSMSAIAADKRDPGTREAQAARQEARQGRLGNDVDQAQLDRNRYARCERLSAEDRSYCVRRMNGEGTVSGSVEGGGILRELWVPVQAPDQSK